MHNAHSSQAQQANVPRCPLCGNQHYRREEGRLDSKWGMSSHKIILLICNHCQYILHFYNGNSIWDFD